MTQPAPLRQQVLQQVAVYNQAHPRAPIDPGAALAVAAQEGLGGGIGDGGHAFGPFQLNNAGGVITGRFAGQTPQQIQQWATSPEGIQYALAGIGRVAGGEHGSQAVRDIVSQFERPANIPREIQGALEALGQPPAPIHPGYGGTALPAATGNIAAAAGAPSAGTPRPAPDFGPQLRAQLLQAAGTPTNDLSSFYGVLRQALQARQAAQHPATVTPSVTPGGGGLVAQPGQQPPTHTLPLAKGQVLGNTTGENPGFLASLAELAAYEHAPVQINSGYRSTAKQAQLYANRANNPNPVAPPGHSLHEQGLAADGTVGGKPLGTLPAALLARYGLMPVPGDPVHVQVLR